MSPLALSDSLAATSAPPNECPKCGGLSQIARGLCLGCLLSAAAEAGENLPSEEFERALDSIPTPDVHWRIGNYEILQEIGRGGMGVIYRARQRHSRRIVALKRVLGYHADSRETLARFRREAEAAASLDHPNILPIYEVGESEEGVPFFSMKFASGGSLQDVGPALRNDPREIVRLMAKVTRAVQHAHRQGLLHRDLKPGNILLDGRGEPLVSDFGLAKWLDGSNDLTRTLTVFGTPGYIAPEQAEGRAAAITPAADVYSLGAILFELLTGQPPFLGEHAIAVIRQAAEKPAPKLRSLVKGADKDLETICARCLEREPTARYRSAGDLGEDLERWLEGRAIIARPVSPPVTAWRWARRNPALAASFAGIFLLAAIATTWRFETRHLAATVRDDELTRRSVIVLPFLNLDTAQPDDSLGVAIAQDLQASLSKFAPARVTAIEKSNPYWADTASLADLRAANQSINARTVLTGSERLINEKRRISIRLVGAATGDSLFSHSFEINAKAQLSEPIGVLAAPIFAILDSEDWSRMTLSGRDPGLRDDAAREYIVSGRQLMFRDSPAEMDRSLRCLEKAIALQPDSAIAHSYFSATAAGRTHFQWDKALLSRAEKEAKEALRLEPDLPDAHRALAGAYYQMADFRNAAEEQFRAIETGGPEELIANFVGVTLSRLGQPGKAIDWLQMARHWQSRPGMRDVDIADCWSALGASEQAEQGYRRAMELSPDQCIGWVGLCHEFLLEHKISEARDLCQQNRNRSNIEEASDTRPDQMAAQFEFFTRNYAEAERLYETLAARDPGPGEDFYGAVTYESAIGRLQQLLGRNEAGRASLLRARDAELASPTSSRTAEGLYRIAAIDCSLGNASAALEALEKAIKVGWTGVRTARLDPRFDGIMSNPAFENALSNLEHRLAAMRVAALQREFKASDSGGLSPRN